jgi:hypothetical protein
MTIARWRGLGGNREVPPTVIRAEGAGRMEEEGGSWGKHGFSDAPEPKAEVGR